MAQKNPIPEWLRDVLSLVARIKDKARHIRAEGQEEITRGIEKVTYANQLEREADYITNVFAQDIPAEDLEDEIITISGSFLRQNLLNSNNRLDVAAQYVTIAGEIGQDHHELFLHAVSDSDSSSGSAVYLGASIENRLHALTPRPIVFSHENPPERLNSRDALLDELTQKLNAIDEKFSIMLNGSEQALNSQDDDAYSQATHSMRDCFQQLIEYLAPNEAVRAQAWYEPVEGPPQGVSRRQRIRYILYGSGEGLDGDTIKTLEEVVSSAKNSLDLCIARAHEHDPKLTRTEVSLTIDQARHALNRLLH